MNEIATFEQVESLVFGKIEDKLQQHLKTQYPDLPYEYAIIKTSYEELKDNSATSVDHDTVRGVPAIYFTSLRDQKFIKLTDYSFKENNYGQYFLNSDLFYHAETNLIEKLKQKAVNKIIKTACVENFSNAVVYLRYKCKEYSVQDQYLDFLDYAKSYFLKQEEKKLDIIINNERKDLCKEQKKREETSRKIKLVQNYTEQIEEKKKELKKLEKELKN